MERSLEVSKEDCLKYPLYSIGANKRAYGRYKAFQLRDDGDDNFWWQPHHNIYERIWTAVRWGLYRWYITPQNPSFSIFDHPRFILDIYTGQIVWQNFDDTKTDTYKYKNIGANYGIY